MARLRGRAATGYPATRRPPARPWKVTTLLAGLLLSGVAALFVLGGPLNRVAFKVFSNACSFRNCGPEW